MSGSRRRFSREFKIEVVRRVKEQGIRRPTAERSRGAISPSIVTGQEPRGAVPMHLVDGRPERQVPGDPATTFNSPGRPAGESAEEAAGNRFPGR